MVFERWGHLFTTDVTSESAEARQLPLVVTGDVRHSGIARHVGERQHGDGRPVGKGRRLERRVITSYSIHYTKLYEAKALITDRVFAATIARALEIVV